MNDSHLDILEDQTLFPVSVTHLIFGDNYNQPLSRGVIPGSVTHLTFGTMFDQPILPGDIPESVTHLTFGDYYNQPLSRGVIPGSVTHLTFGTTFDHPILPGDLPDSLTHLTLSDMFIQKITPSLFPKSLTHLTFGGAFNQPISKGGLPKSLTHLAFGKYFNQPISKTNLPGSLTHLTFGYYYDQPLSPGDIPGSVTHLTFGEHYNQPLSPGIIPGSLTHLILGYMFNQSLSPGDIPGSVTHLTFGEYYNQSLSPGDIPGSVTHLAFGDNYNQPLSPGVIPGSVTHLAFGSRFNQPLSPGDIPESIEMLKFSSNYSMGIPEGVVDMDNVEIIPIGVKEMSKIKIEWNRFVVKTKDPKIGMEVVIKSLKDLYLKGIPVPVENHGKTLLPDGGIPDDILRYFSLSRDEHKICHIGFPKKLQNLIYQWIYNENYGKFNSFISSLNTDSKEEFKDDVFLGEYTSAEEAYLDMRQAIMSAPSLDHVVFAWRGMHGMKDLCMNAVKGSYVGFSRFTACSVAQEVSCEFARDGVILLIELPEKTPLLNLTCIKNSEPEFILPDRTVFKVVNRIPYRNLCMGVECDELVHIRLVGIYNKDRSDFELYLDTENPEEIRIETVY